MTCLSRWKVPMACCILVAAISAGGASLFRFVDYSLPMMRCDYDRALQTAYFGDLAIPHFNSGLAAYEENDYDGARKAMERALAQCVGSDGQLKESHRELAAQCQFYIGNCYYNSNKRPEAVTAYEECLKLHPPHLWAKYNLEKLQENQPQSPQGGKGAGRSTKI